MGIWEKILLGIENFCRKLYALAWRTRIRFTTKLQRRINVRRIKSRSKRM
jgi:hypothetical protein